jgi:CBS-domain-containing membrane protein
MTEPRAAGRVDNPDEPLELGPREDFLDEEVATCGKGRRERDSGHPAKEGLVRTMGATEPAWMREIKLAREVMIPLERYPTVRVNTTLKDAIAVIEEAQLDVGRHKSLPRALLVFDETEQLVGCVRRRDLMRGLEPKFLVSQPLEYRKKLFDVATDPNLSELSYDRVSKAVREQARRPVSDVMHPIEVTIGADDHIIKAVYEMVSLNLSLIPVVKEGRVVGVLRSVDVFHELAQLLS